MLNGFEIAASVDEQETTVLAVAGGATTREAFTDWIERHVQSMDAPV